MKKQPIYRSKPKSTAPSKFKPYGGHLVIGNRAVMEALLHKSKNIRSIFLAKDHKLLSDDLRHLIEREKIIVETVSKDDLTTISGTDSHQGIAAAMKSEHIIPLDDLIKKTEDEESTLLLALDSIYDPQNLGSILRASECFGVSGVIWSKNRGVDLTPSATKASAGASELVDIVKVSNLAESLQKLQDIGFVVIAADAAQDAIPLNDFQFPNKAVLLLGSEGEGIRPLLLKRADHRVYIPMRGKIDSLNVSQAAAVMMSCWSLNT